MTSAVTALSAENRDHLPNHVAVIMDGNGRWAKERSLPRVEGHRAGADSVRAVVETAGELGIRYLTLYAFSVENWSRPQSEIDVLMDLLAHYLKNEADQLERNNVHLDVIGRISGLPGSVQDELKETVHRLSGNTGLNLVVALNYGARSEIVDTVREIAEEAKQGSINPEDIDEGVVAAHLYTRGLPDPELLIRTSGEMRVSNFLLWQISYAEFVVTPTLWPDFRRKDFLACLEEYGRRHRRFGGVE